jgi:hypothetical protein
VSHTIQIGPVRDLVVGAYEHQTGCFAHLLDARWPEDENPRLHVDAQTPDTLRNTLREVGYELDDDIVEQLWRDVRNSAYKRLSALPADHPDRRVADRVLRRLEAA